MSGKEKKQSIRVVTPHFRVSFPHLDKPHSGFKNQEPVYSLQMLFPKGTDLTEMKKAVHQAKVNKWGPNKDKWPKNLRSPFKDGNEKNLENYVDMTVIEARTKLKPGIVDRDLNEIMDAKEVYAGCWGRATLTCYAYDNAGNRGVSFGLQNVQKVKDDKAFSGKKNAKDDFDKIEGLDDDEDYNNDDSSSESEDYDDDF